MKCNCSFNFTIYLEMSTQCWFLRSRQRYLSGATSHTNHVWIPPELVITSKDHLNLSSKMYSAHFRPIKLKIYSTHFRPIKQRSIAHILDLSSQKYSAHFGPIKLKP